MRTKTVIDCARYGRVGQLPLIAAVAWSVLGLAAITWPGTESRAYQLNRSRLERMSPERRHETWQKYQEFLALPDEERERIRRFSADLQRQPPDKRERYQGIMDRYLKWKDSLPLYQQQMLDESATRGSNELYAKFREVQARKENEDRRRDYWFVPEAPAIRKAIPRVLDKLRPEEIEELDQTSPLDRLTKLIAAAQRFGVEVPASGVGAAAPSRPWLRGPLPPPDPEKFRDYLQRLPRDNLEELGDLGLIKRARERRLFELYYREHPDELRARTRKHDAAIEPGPSNGRGPRPNGSENHAPQIPNRDQSTKTPGKIGIAPSK